MDGLFGWLVRKLSNCKNVNVQFKKIQRRFINPAAMSYTGIPGALRHTPGYIMDIDIP